MVSEKKRYVCNVCGANYTKWQGQCSFCKTWNSLEEETIKPTFTSKNSWKEKIISNNVEQKRPKRLEEINCSEYKRYTLEDTELNRVLGGGLVAGSFVLIGGEPGIGKSTLILQTILRSKGFKTLYVSGEESDKQIKMRAERIGGRGENLFILSETNLEVIIEICNELHPSILIIDSIQTIYTHLSESSAGSATQIRECANLLLRYAKEKNISVVIIGHITKEGSIAGPKVLEHTVDCVLQFEGDEHFFFRILRCLKNRFGSTNELGIYEMHGDGLRIIQNPSRYFITENTEGLSGRCIAVALEGIRPLLIETQGLVSSAIYPNPQRSATGFDIKRMNMLLAVLEKRAGFKLLKQDVFLNIAGGLKINDPAVDVSVLVSILSSTLDRSIRDHLCFTGEVGLSGEIRPVSRINTRINEAERLGYKSIVVPRENFKTLNASNYSIKLLPVGNVEELFRNVFKCND